MGIKKRENEKLEQKAKTQKIINIILVIVIIISLVVISIILNTKDKKTAEELNSDNSNTNIDTNIYDYNLTKAEKDIEDKFLISDKPVLVDYYADWCGPCVMMAPIIEELQNDQEDFYVQKVDVDKYRNLADKAGAYSIPYFVLYNNGEFISSTVGVQTKENLIDFVKKNIKE